MTNEEVLEALAEHARRRREEGAFRLLPPYDGYVRVNGAGYRAVSVHPDFPLCQFVEGGTRDLAGALAQVQERPRPIRSLAEHPRPERELQAHLIREALRSGGDLLAVLGRDLPFDRLLFAVDEVRLDDGDIRCDLLAVGVRGEVAVPVLVELKYGRLLSELVDQLRAFRELVWKHEEAFGKLLCAATGARVSMEALHLMIVWPLAEGGREMTRHTRETLEAAGVLAVGFERGDGWRFEAELGRAAAHPNPRR